MKLKDRLVRGRAPINDTASCLVDSIKYVASELKDSFMVVPPVEIQNDKGIRQIFSAISDFIFAEVKIRNSSRFMKLLCPMEGFGGF